MEKELNRIKEIDVEIANFQKKIASLEEEKNALFQVISAYKAQNLRLLSGRARNALTNIGIDTDEKLFKFLYGDCSFILPKYTRFNISHYPEAKTMLKRLMCIDNIGEGTAKEILTFLSSKGLIWNQKSMWLKVHALLISFNCFKWYIKSLL